jgi:Na+/H+ antiporter NhaD/arsenite permease-like protein
MLDLLQNKALISTLIFIIAYIFILFEKFFHRTVTVLIFGSVVILIGLIEPSKAWNYIDYNTIFLLFGMMNIVIIMGKSGLFHLLASKILDITGNNIYKIIIFFSVFTAIASALVDNVTTVLFLTPIIIRLCENIKVNPIPIVISIVLASNTGGTTTLIGDPPNIIIGSIAKKSFVDFLIHVTIPAITGFITGLIINILMLKKIIKLDTIKIGKEDIEEIEKLEKELVLDYKLMKISVLFFILTIVMFILGHKFHWESGIIALFTSSLLMLFTKLSPIEIFERIEWATIFFFVGLFMIVGAMEEHKVFHFISEKLITLIGDNLYKGMLIVSLFSMFISGFVDNIPYTVAFSKVLKEIVTVNPSLDPLWWALSIGACMGGNLTLIGASANIVAADIATRKGYKIDFITFLKYGTPVALISTITAIITYIILHIYILH